MWIVRKIYCFSTRSLSCVRLITSLQVCRNLIYHACVYHTALSMTEMAVPTSHKVQCWILTESWVYLSYKHHRKLSLNRGGEQNILLSAQTLAQGPKRDNQSRVKELDRPPALREEQPGERGEKRIKKMCVLMKHTISLMSQKSI